MTRVNLLKETLGDGESIADKDPVKSGEGQDCSDGDVQRFKAGSCADWGILGVRDKADGGKGGIGCSYGTGLGRQSCKAIRQLDGLHECQTE